MPTILDVPLARNVAAKLISKSPQWLGKLVAKGYVKPLARGQYDAVNVVAGNEQCTKDGQKVTAHSKAITSLAETRVRMAALAEAKARREFVPTKEAVAAVTHVEETELYELRLVGPAAASALGIRYTADFRTVLAGVVDRALENHSSRAAAERAALTTTGAADPSPIAMPLDTNGATPKPWLPEPPEVKPYMGNDHFDHWDWRTWSCRVAMLANPHADDAAVAAFVNIGFEHPLTQITPAQVAGLRADEISTTEAVRRAVARMTR